MHKYILPILGLIFGVCFFNLAVTGFDLKYIPGDAGDSRFINYLLEHGYLYLAGQENDFWNAPFMFPQHNVIAFSDNMLGTIPVYSFFRIIGNDRETAYQLWWISISILNFCSCYFVLLKVTNQPVASFIGAFIFAFGLFNQSQMSYLQMNIRFPIPFIFYYAIQLVNNSSIRNYLLYALWLVLQFYCVIYTGIMAFYLSLIFIAITAIYQKKIKFIAFYFQKSIVALTLLITTIAIYLLYILFKPYIEISHITGLRMFNEVVPTIPMFTSWFFSHESSFTWSFLSQHLKSSTPAWYLHTIFPGILSLGAYFLSLLVIVKGIIKKQPVSKTLVIVFIITTTIFLLFTRTQTGYTLYAIIFKLPGMNSLRVLTRVMHIQLFFLCTLLALLITQLYSQKTLGKTYIFSICLMVVVVADNAFFPSKTLRSSKIELQNRINQITHHIRPNNAKILVLINEDKYPAYFTHLDAMLAAQSLNMKCVNAYTSYCPKEFGAFFLHPGQNELNRWIGHVAVDTTQLLKIKVQ